MAHMTKNTYTMTIENVFKGGDTRLTVIDNPREGITASEIKDFETWCKTNQPIVGDKAGTDFLRFNSPVKLTQKSVTVLDLNL